MKASSFWMLGLVAIMFGSTPSQAAPVPLKTLIDTHGTLTLGDKKFADFGFSGNVSQIDPATILVEVFGSPGCLGGLRFSGSTMTAAGGPLDFELKYSVEIVGSSS